ncbi:MAG: hypothetical protein C0467_25790 [Planctomycetaceae bacterium]|nr:hypothetical protein [Planctomycetaceae bacterium]
MNPLPAPRVLEHFFLEARCKLLDLAGILDRIGRGADVDAVTADARAEKINKAFGILMSDAPNKAELIQKLFSLAYDPEWKRPSPRF